MPQGQGWRSKQRGGHELEKRCLIWATRRRDEAVMNESRDGLGNEIRDN